MGQTGLSDFEKNAHGGSTSAADFAHVLFRDCDVITLCAGSASNKRCRADIFTVWTTGTLTMAYYPFCGRSEILLDAVASIGTGDSIVK